MEQKENKERKERQRIKRTENNVMLVRNLLEQNKTISIREIKSKMKQLHSVSLSNDTIQKIFRHDLNRIWKPFTKTQFITFEVAEKE